MGGGEFPAWAPRQSHRLASALPIAPGTRAAAKAACPSPCIASRAPRPPARSVQYLQRPEAVFAEVYRVLRPGGCAIFTFSNRMFYNKAIAAWRDAGGYARCQLVKQ